MSYPMKSLLGRTKVFCRIFAVLTLFSTRLLAGDFPEKSTTLVTDYTSTLSDNERAQLEQKLVSFNDSTSTQVAVVMLSSIGNYDVADYTVQLYNRWGIGQQNKNNGVLILVAKDDRKVWITTGYGIEGVLPDVLCKRIVDNDITPNFKNGDFYGGLDAATTSIMSLVKGEYTADEYMQRKSKPVFFPILLGLFIVLIVIFSKYRSARNYATRNNLGFWAAWMLLNAASRRSHGSWGNFNSGGGGFGGGGFGGFGGGSSGGGGAGGSW